MKKYSLKIIVITIGLLNWSCSINDGTKSLSGGPSTAGFSFPPVVLPDTLPYLATVEFTNLSTDAFSYQWDFNDGSAKVTTKNAKHTFATTGEFNVALYSVGSNGSSKIVKRVFLPNVCDNADFNSLTSCNKKGWILSSAADAFVETDASGAVLSTKAANSCQTDDDVTYSVDGGFAYGAGKDGKTFNGTACVDKLANASRFKIEAIAGQKTKIILNSNGLLTGNVPFLGSSLQVKNNSYTVESLTDGAMTVKGELLSGNFISVKFIQKPSGLAGYLTYLTGGSSRSWRLDTTAAPGPIVVGPSDADPTSFFGGGALAGCQKDDIYTFSATTVTYNSNGETLIAADNFSCGAGLDYADVAYTFSNVGVGSAGLAQISLSANFIGITDRAAENIYRILEIDDERMVLRSGNGTGSVVHTIKFLRAD
ncbi:MAG: PKD domain-containing protein [Cytophagales bacterium]